MHLSSKIVTDGEWELQKELQCYFDHPYQLLIASHPVENMLFPLTEHCFLPYLIAQHQESCYSQCILAYKFLIDIKALQTAAQQEHLNVQVLEYDHKKQTLKSLLNDEEGGQVGEEWATVVTLRSEGRTTQVYLLPFSRGEEELLASRSIHQNFQLLKVIDHFLALQSNWKGSHQFEDPLLRHLSEFLYLGSVKAVRLILWVDQCLFDKKLLEQVGKLKLPQLQLQQEKYRCKKMEMFRTKAQEYQLLTVFRQQKEQFTATINTLQRLASLPPQPYQLITVDSLKQLKQEGFIEKTIQIKDLENKLAKLALREATLRQRMVECKQKMQDLQKKHTGEILSMKRQVGAMFPKEAPRSQGLLFSHTRRSSQQRFLKTSFTHNQKKTSRIYPTTQPIPEPPNRTSDNSDNSKPRSVKDAHKTRKDEFKNNEKKVASVVRDGNLQVDRKQLREDYQTEMSRIDFQMEERHDELLRKYQVAARAIRRAMENNQEMRI